MFAELLFSFRTLHEGILAQRGQRVDGADGVRLDVTPEDVLYVHDVQVLSFHQLLEGVYAQGVVYHLGAYFTVHVPGQVVAQGGIGHDERSDDEQHAQREYQPRKPVQFGHVQCDDVLQRILVGDGQAILEADVLPPVFSFLFLRCHASSTFSKFNRPSGRLTVITRCSWSMSVMNSKINFVDLAGSEKFETLSNDVDQRKLEARHINKSLLTLQNVVIGLNHRQKHIPFRDSALTRFLKDSLVGNVKTAMIATLSTKKDHLVETMSTCRFAESVASVSTTTRVNQQELPPQEIIARLREEVSRLREELGRGGGVPLNGSGPISLPRARVVTEEEAVELQDKVVAFVEDTTDQLDVWAPAEVQFCFHFMKDLIRRGNSSALRVSQLQQRLDESQKSVQSLVGLLRSRQRSRSGEFVMSKEAAFLEFYNSHEKCSVAQGLKQSLKERIGAAKQLNEAGTELRQKRDDLQNQMDLIEEDIDSVNSTLASCTDDAEREQCEHDLEDLKDRQAALSPELEKAISDCSKNSDDLNFCKDEIVALNREYAHAKQIIEQDFEKFWMNTVMRYSQQPKSPSTPKSARKPYSTTSGSASKRPK